MSRRALTCAAVVVSFAMAAADLAAQVTAGEIFGNVKDSTNAVLPGVTITVQGSGVMGPVVAVSSTTGGYRFPAIPIGTYTVTFDLEGFQRLVRTGIRIETGFAVELSPQLSLSGVVETVTVSGETPVVDTKSNAVRFTFNREMLEKLPTARDPWVVLEQMPGMVMDRQNVGGSESGQQSSFIAHGMGGNEIWSLNGATVTDPEAGASPMYFDFDSFEEIQIQTGGGDASMESGNAAINLVTKSGSNTLRGTSRFFVVNDALQADNGTPELRAIGAGSGNPIHEISDYGVEVGGPIVRDRAWFWGAAARNDIRVGIIGFLKPGATDPNDPASLETDRTLLKHVNAKVNYAWTPAQRSTVFHNFSDKFRSSRGVGALTTIDAAVKQTSPGHTVQAEHQWVVNDRLMLNGMFTYQGNHFVLDFTRPELADVQRTFDIETQLNAQSAEKTDNDRPTYESRLDGNYFLTRFGGDHAFKFGAKYKRNPYAFSSQYGGGVQARFIRGIAVEAELRRDAAQISRLENWSWWINDTFRRGRLTVNAGLRYDRYDDRALPSTVAANRIAPELLPALAFPGLDPDIVFSNFSPRAGIVYDLFGTGKTVAKVSAARYNGSDMDVADHLNPVARTRLRFPWSDTNGDRVVQRNELDTTRVLFSENYNAANPTDVSVFNTVDPDFDADKTDELIASLEHELAVDFSVSVSFILKHLHDQNGIFAPGVTSADYIPRTFTRPCGNASCDQPSYTAVYYELPFLRASGRLLRNRRWERSYRGWELVARKRFTDRWMAAASVTLNDTTIDFKDASAYEDPTNIDMLDGYQTGTLNTRWVGKISGLYVFAKDIELSAFYNFRDGVPAAPEILSPPRAGGLGSIGVYVRPWGEDRTPAFHQVDIRVGKTFALWRGQRLVASVDLFNLLNANTVLNIVERQNAINANFPTNILAPRAVRVGVRYTF
jgi:hypothetical protein